MSDDGYYEEFDDFEDAMWDADPAPDLADDLAAHAAYSPVWQDDPVGELDPYYSDWEYYSDDYYDDDPVLKRSTLDGGVNEPATKSNGISAKRGRKRKLQEVRDSDNGPTIGSLADCIKGTVWAQEQQTRSLTLFNLGQAKGVALLRNWRDVFKTQDGAPQTFGRGQLQKDRTWANDLSLADMGLFNEHGRSEGTRPPDLEADDDAESTSSHMHSPSEMQIAHEDGTTESLADLDDVIEDGKTSVDHGQPSQPTEFLDGSELRTHKRRRLEAFVSTPGLPSGIDGTPVELLNLPDATVAKQGHQSTDNNARHTRATTRSRKRKMSVSDRALELEDGLSVPVVVQSDTGPQTHSESSPTHLVEPSLQVDASSTRKRPKR